MYKDYVKLPKNEDKWISELIGFIENYEFPCVVHIMAFIPVLNQNLKAL